MLTLCYIYNAIILINLPILNICSTTTSPSWSNPLVASGVPHNHQLALLIFAATNHIIARPQSNKYVIDLINRQKQLIQLKRNKL